MPRAAGKVAATERAKARANMALGQRTLMTRGQKEKRLKQMTCNTLMKEAACGMKMMLIALGWSMMLKMMKRMVISI